MLVDFGRHGDVDQPIYAMFGHDRGNGLVGRRFIWDGLLALLAFLQRVDLSDGTGDALS